MFLLYFVASLAGVLSAYFFSLKSYLILIIFAFSILLFLAAWKIGKRFFPWPIFNLTRNQKFGCGILFFAYPASFFYRTESYNRAFECLLKKDSLEVQVCDRSLASSGNGFNYTLDLQDPSGYKIQLFSYRRLELDSIYLIRHENLELKPEDSFGLIRDSILARGFFKFAKFLRNGPQPWGRFLEQESEKRLSGQASKLYNSIFLGKKSLQSGQEIKEYFLHSGMSHFLARSGLHLVILSSLIGFFLNIFFLNWRTAILLQICFLLFYSILSTASISFIRALLMILIFRLAAVIGRNVSSSDVFLLVLFLTTIWNPYHFFCLDFQLSFSITAALIQFFKNIN